MHMSIFRRPQEPSTSYDELAKRYALLAADLERLRGAVSALQSEWESQLALIRKERNRIEEAERRRNRKDAEENEAQFSPLSDDRPQGGVEGHGFADKLRRLQRGG